MTRPRIEHLHALILAGGSGTRFWPLSRELSPKQFLSIFGGVSLITRAVLRIAPYAEDGGIHVLTNERLFDELRNHLTAQPSLKGWELEYLAEPLPRNTAPAIALAAAYLQRCDPEAIIAVLPSDHLLEDGERWGAALRCAVALARQGWLVTLGLRPDRPETGYGYIRAGARIDLVCDVAAADKTTAAPQLEGFQAASFIEKPSRETAERFCSEGSYLWNSGMLVARADAILSELVAAGKRAETPESAASEEIAHTALRVAADAPSRWTRDAARQAFAALPAVPFDKAVLEVSPRVAVVPVDLAWSDVGSLLALEKISPPDEHGNVFAGKIVDVDSARTIVYSADRLIATIGLTDLMVVDTADATLVAPKDRAQDVRLIVDKLRAAQAPEAIESRSSLRPWGSWTKLTQGSGFQVKTIEVLPGCRLSLQSHEHRSEHWVVVEGTARITRDSEVFDIGPNESAYIPRGSVHRLANNGTGLLRVIEVAVGDDLSETDIIRYEDDWAR